ncbi:uncharacterized protein LOC124594461 [Schistocerca americana]|uniref:uncharacterized protein LOC124594461 n=1 Tax=Schistocerca americana TaxID=7009 RepID=UPI001F4F46C2|nr:uncharacterized protein LOC124594461 [Schistocerca americana]XP_049949158.1 uncharacterized protein LOC126457135 [Schistocerca serialis cubense]
MARPPLLPLLLVLLTAGCGVYAARRCQDTHAQSQLDLNKVTGQWYVVEIVEHDPKVLEMSMIEQRKCPIVVLHRQNSTGSWLTLKWTEGRDVVVYNLNVTDMRRALGRWQSVGKQEGSMTRRENYQHFDGVVLVLKAVEDHMVLTFCDRNPERSPYTLVLSRAQRMPGDDIDSINNMIRFRELYMGLVKSTCPGAAAAVTHSPALIAVGALAAVVRLLLGRGGPS